MNLTQPAVLELGNLADLGDRMLQAQAPAVRSHLKTTGEAGVDAQVTQLLRAITTRADQLTLRVATLEDRLAALEHLPAPRPHWWTRLAAWWTALVARIGRGA